MTRGRGRQGATAAKGAEEKTDDQPANNNVLIIFPYLAVCRLQTLWVYCKYRQRCNNTLHMDMFKSNMMDKWTNWIGLLEEKKEVSTEAQSPGKLKEFSKWTLWDEAFCTYVDQLCSPGTGILLSYLLWDEPNLSLEMMAQTGFLTIKDDLVHTTAYSGPAFQADNKRLYKLLKPLVVNGPAWPFMQPYNRTQDGRGAFLAIKAQAKGPAAITTCKAAAYAQIALAKFTGKGCCTFDQYIARHQKAFNELETLGQPLPDNKKVGNFMFHIHDACLTTTRDLIFGNPEYSNSFEKTQQYCKELAVCVSQSQDDCQNV